MLRSKPILTAQQIASYAEKPLILDEPQKVIAPYDRGDNIPCQGKFQIMLTANGVLVRCPCNHEWVRQLHDNPGRPGLCCVDCRTKRDESRDLDGLYAA